MSYDHMPQPERSPDFQSTESESLEELLNLPRIHPLLRPLTFEEGMRRRPTTVDDLIGHEKMAEIHANEREAQLKARKASRERAKRRKAGNKAIQRAED